MSVYMYIQTYKIPWWVSNHETGLWGWKYSLPVFFPISIYIYIEHRNSTELRKHMRTLKENNINQFNSWRILSSRSPYSSASSKKNLCLKKITHHPHHSINIMNSCPPLATETKRYCVTIELSTEINKHAHYANFKVYKRWYEYS